MENWQRTWIDYYEALGLAPSADSEVIKAVYRRLARIYGTPGGSTPDEAKFRIINEAHAILTVPDKRAAYDQEHRERRKTSHGTRAENQETNDGGSRHSEQSDKNAYYSGTNARNEAPNQNFPGATPNSRQSNGYTQSSGQAQRNSSTKTRRRFLAASAAVLSIAAGGAILRTITSDSNDGEPSLVAPDGQPSERRLDPTATPEATAAAPPATATPQATVAAPPATAKPGQLVYAANWSAGLDGWSTSSAWSALGGALVNNGSKDIYSPSQLDMIGPSLPLLPRDYAIDADFSIQKWPGTIWWSRFGVVGRYNNKSAYLFGFELNTSSQARILYDGEGNVGTGAILGKGPFDIAINTPIHIRAECQRNELRLLINGITVCSATDNRLLEPGRVGLWCSAAQATVTAFSVTAL